MEPSTIGTIAITGADGQVGRALFERLRLVRARTVALTRKPAKLPANEVIVGQADRGESSAPRDCLRLRRGGVRRNGHE